MSQPPDDDYYNAPTENGSLPPRQWPGYPQQTASPNYPPQQSFPPNQRPISRPGFPPAQGPLSQPGFPPSQEQVRQLDFSPAQRPISQPGFPPNQRPLSQPGFSPQPSSYPQQVLAPNYPGQQASWPGNFSSNQGPVSYPGERTQQNFQPPQWQRQYNAPPATPKLAPPEEPKKSKKGLITVISIVLVLLLVGGGIAAFLVLGQRGNAHNPSSRTNTPVTGHPTAGTTQPAGGPSSGTGQPTQAGSIWLVTITHATTATSSQFPPAANNTYLEISLTLKNVTATPQPVSSLIQFSLVGTDGAKYTESLTDTNIHQTPDASVPGGQTLSAQLAYQVPKSKHAFTLSFAYGLINGSNASVSWQINI